MHELPVGHVLLCPCPQEELPGNQGLDVHHEVNLDTALRAASLPTAFAKEVEEASKRLGSRGKWSNP